MLAVIEGGLVGIAPRAEPSVWVVEWSDRQQAFHITTLERSVRANFGAWLDGRPSDYHSIWQGDSHEAAHAFIAEAEKLRGDKPGAPSGL